MIAAGVLSFMARPIRFHQLQTVEGLKALAAEHGSVQRVADVLECSFSYVAKRFDALGVERPKGPRKKAPCPEGCECKRHAVTNAGQFGAREFPWQKGQDTRRKAGWSEAAKEARKTSSRFKGGTHTPEAREKISEANRQRKGNRTGVNKSRDYPPEYAELRLLVFARDDFRCVLCGRRGLLHCHHLNYDKTDNRMDNAVSLCGRCHISHHAAEGWPIDLFSKIAENGKAQTVRDATVPRPHSSRAPANKAGRFVECLRAGCQKKV